MKLTKKWPILIFLIVFIIFFGLFIKVKIEKRRNVESKTFVDTVVPSILSKLDCGIFLHYLLDDDVDKKVWEDKCEETFATLKKLGQFKKYNGSNGKAIFIIPSTIFPKNMAYYNTSSEFEKGTLSFNVILTLKGSEWKISKVHFASDAFNEIGI